MYHYLKRFLAMALALALVLSLVPVLSPHAHAAGTVTLADANIGLSWTDASSSSGKANWSGSGTTVTGTAKGYKGGFLNLTSYAVTTTLTITNNHSEDRTLSFDYTLTGGGSVSGPISGTSGSYSQPLAAGKSVTITLTSPEGTGTNTLTISSLQLLSSENVTSTFLAPENGSYTVDGVAVTAQTTREKPATEAYALAATPATDYIFFGWWSEASQSYVSYEATASLKFSSDPQLKPVFLHNTTALFGVGTKTFADLTEAANFAASSAATTKTVVLLNNGTVSGNHTIPAGVTLLIPHDANNTSYGSSASCTTETILGFADSATAWVQPTPFRTLTLAENASISVNGAIELAGRHAASNGAKTYCGAPSGPLGWMKMESGSNITLNSGANLYCWGYIQGSGTITAKSGTKVYENFQFTDFRGGSNLTAMMGDTGKALVFPINQYYVQNIQVPTTYECGAEEYVATSAFSSKQVLGGTVKFLGAGGMFVPDTGATITKDYIENRDRLQIDVAGNASLKNLKVDVSIEVDSAAFVLPITNNITINILSGTTTVQQSVSLLPGVEMSIANGASLVIANKEGGINDYTTEAYALIVYDYDEWTYGMSMTDGSVVTGTYAFGDGSKNYAGQMAPLNYVPGRTYNRTVANDLKDAKLDINGTLIANGYLYTTLGGGNIMSSGKTGKIVLQSGAGSDMMDFQSNAAESLIIPMNSAQLKNGDGSYESTYIYSYDDAGALVVDYQAPAGTTYDYCATHDCWYTGECEACKVPTYTITFLNEDGTTFQTLTVEEGQTPTADMPSKESTAPYNYTFAGWDLCVDGAYDSKADDVAVATDNATYKALFTASTRTYDVVFYDEDGTTVLYTAEDVDYGATPSYEGNMTKKVNCTTYNVSFPTVTAVDGTNLSYTASWTEGETKHTDGEAVKEKEVAPDCINTGSYESVVYCTVCKAEMSRKTITVGALGHTAVTDQAVAPTCANTGLTEGSHCSVCNKVLVAQEVVDALGHSYNKGVITTNPGCETAGQKTFTCGTCGDSYTEPVEATGHTEGQSVIENVNNADCDTEGSYDRVVYCSECNKELSRKTIHEDALGHSYNKGVITTEPGCETTGVKTFTCGTCGDTYTEPVPATGHTAGDAVVENEVDATCGADGSYDTVVRCAVCNKELSRVTTTVEALGHTGNDAVVENEIDATCGASGSYDTVVYCSVCNEELSRVTTTVEALGHSYNDGVITDEPDCENAGVKTFTCGTCGDTYTEAVSATGHTNGEAVKENEVAPDCDDEGSYDTVVYCTACKAELSRKTTTVEALGHTKGEAIVENEVAADCDTEGSYDTVVRCAVCKAELSRETTTVNALGHTNGEAVKEKEVAPDCDDEGSYDTVVYCTVCKAEVSRETTTVNALGHTGNDAVVENEVAADCDTEGSYDTVVYCSVCNEELSRKTTTVEALGHTEGEAVVENEVAADCDTEGSYDTVVRCAVCKTELSRVTTTVDALGHSNGEAVKEKEVAPDCINTGSYDTVVYCTVCKAELSRVTTPVEALGHTAVTDEAVAPTCIDTGLTEGSHCSVCNKVLVAQEVVDALDHAWGEPTYTVNTDGTHTASYVCTRDESHTKSDAPAEHEYENGSCICEDIQTFTVIWNVEGVETSVTVKYGQTPVFETTPQKAPADGFTYTFKGWDKQIVSAESNATYTAVFAKTGFDNIGSDRVYLVEDEVQKTGWTQIGEAWYYLDTEDGALACGIARVPYPAVSINGITYAADQEAMDYAQSKGQTFIDAAEAWFVFDQDGKLLQDTGAVNDGANWAVNGMLAWHPGLVKIGNDYYYYTGDVDNGGNKLASGNIYLSKDNTDLGLVTGGVYTLDENGKLFLYDGITDIDGKLYYYDGYRLMLGHGLLLKEGSYYYVKSDGSLATDGKYWVAKVNEYTDIAVGEYEFGADGKMTIPEVEPAKDGIYYEDGGWYYYENGALGYCKGLMAVEEVWHYADGSETSCKAIIYVRSDGQLATGTYYVTIVNNDEIKDIQAGDKVVFDDEGKAMLKKEGIVANDDGSLWYYENGELTYGGLIQVEGDYYYVRSNGKVVVDQSYWVTKTNGLLPAAPYTFGADGKMLVDTVGEIRQENGALCYYVGGIKQTGNGLVELEPNVYIYVRSNGELAVGNYWVTNHNGLLSQGLYNFSAEGKLTIN